MYKQETMFAKLHARWEHHIFTFILISRDKNDDDDDKIWFSLTFIYIQSASEI